MEKYKITIKNYFLKYFTHNLNEYSNLEYKNVFNRF